MGTLLYVPKISNFGFLEEKKNREGKGGKYWEKEFFLQKRTKRSNKRRKIVGEGKYTF